MAVVVQTKPWGTLPTRFKGRLKQLAVVVVVVIASTFALVVAFARWFVLIPNVATNTDCGHLRSVPNNNNNNDYNYNPLESFAENHKGRVVWKWPSYFEIYHRELAALRASAQFERRKVTLVEIGVNTGGAIDMWRDYFGEENLVYHGIDLNPSTASHRDEANKVYIHVGSQDDGEFLSKVVQSVGQPVDVIVDDGAHLGRLTIVAFMHLWSALRFDGGLYLVEDLQSQGVDIFPFASRAAITMNALDKQRAPENDGPSDKECALESDEDGFSPRLRIDNFCREAFRVTAYHAIVVLEKRRMPQNPKPPRMYGSVNSSDEHPQAYRKAKWWQDIAREEKARPNTKRNNAEMVRGSHTAVEIEGWRTAHTAVEIEGWRTGYAAQQRKKQLHRPVLLPPIMYRKDLGILLEAEGKRKGVELGVKTGQFSEIILKEWKSCESYLLVDAWRHLDNYVDKTNFMNDEQDANMRATMSRLSDYHDILDVCRDLTSACVPKVKDDSLDFVYVDARHDRVGVGVDIHEWWSKLRVGGILAGHDYGKSVRLSDRLDGNRFSLPLNLCIADSLLMNFSPSLCLESRTLSPLYVLCGQISSISTVTQSDGPFQTGQNWTINADGTVDSSGLAVVGAGKFVVICLSLSASAPV